MTSSLRSPLRPSLVCQPGQPAHIIQFARWPTPFVRSPAGSGRDSLPQLQPRLLRPLQLCARDAIVRIPTGSEKRKARGADTFRIEKP